MAESIKQENVWAIKEKICSLEALLTQGANV